MKNTLCTAVTICWLTTGIVFGHSTLRDDDRPTTARAYQVAPSTASDISVEDNDNTIIVMPSGVVGERVTNRQNDICDGDTTTVTSYRDDCKIRMYGKLTPSELCDTSGDNWGCSAAKVGPRSYVTAGHCFYGRDINGDLYKAKCAAIWCGESNVPDGTPPEDWVSQMAWTSKWNAYVTNSQGASSGASYDGAVFLAYTGTHPEFSNVGDLTNTGTQLVEISGYGSSTRTEDTCHEGCFKSGWDGRQQRSDIKDANTDLASTGGYFTSKFDACPGHSGSGIWALSVNRYVGTLSASSCGECKNFVVPNVLTSDTGCNGAQGGANWNCLFGALGVANTDASVSENRSKPIVKAVRLDKQ